MCTCRELVTCSQYSFRIICWNYCSLIVFSRIFKMFLPVWSFSLLENLGEKKSCNKNRKFLSQLICLPLAMLVLHCLIGHLIIHVLVNFSGSTIAKGQLNNPWRSDSCWCWSSVVCISPCSKSLQATLTVPLAGLFSKLALHGNVG